MDKTAAAVAVFDKRADRYDELYGDVSQYNQSLHWYADHLKPNAHLLELACGPGNVTRFLLNLRPDSKILATDLAPGMIEIAKKHNPEANFKRMDCRDASQFKDAFDGVVVAFCLPYLDAGDVQQLLKSISNALHDGGLLYLSTMEADESQSGWESSSSGDRVYLYYYESESIKKWLGVAGLSVVYEQRLETVDARGKTNTDLILIAQRIISNGF